MSDVDLSIGLWDQVILQRKDQNGATLVGFGSGADGRGGGGIMGMEGRVIGRVLQEVEMFS